MKSAITTCFAVLVGAMSCFAEGTTDQTAALSKKLDSIVIPTVEFREAHISTVVQFLVDAGKQNDADKTGVNIVLMDKENKSTITLSLNKVSLHEVLKLVAEMAGLSLGFEDGSVVLRKGKQTLRIQADHFVCNAPKEFTASGSVVITMKDGSTIKTDKAVIKTDDEITLSGAKIEFENEKKTEDGK